MTASKYGVPNLLPLLHITPLLGKSLFHSATIPSALYIHWRRINAQEYYILNSKFYFLTLNNTLSLKYTHLCALVSFACFIGFFPCKIKGKSITKIISLQNISPNVQASQADLSTTEDPWLTPDHKAQASQQLCSMHQHFGTHCGVEFTIPLNCHLVLTWSHS